MGFWWVMTTGAIIVLPERYGRWRGIFIAVGFAAAVGAARVGPAAGARSASDEPATEEAT